MKATVIAPANIAFIKYWGKKDEKLRLPMNSSVSMNLSNIFTKTTVEFLPHLTRDEIVFLGEKITEREKERVVNHLGRVRQKARIKTKAKVVTKNNFPKATGLASSAAGFAALTLAGTVAAGLRLSKKELSILARLGSGSACRSISDGFVEWKKGTSSATSYASMLFPPEYWDIRDIVVIVGREKKKVSSTEGHRLAPTSPFFQTRASSMESKVKAIKRLMKERKFAEFGELIEQETINMHTIMMTSNPPIFYWSPKTLEVMKTIWQWRDKDLEVFFTIDAGPNLHLICRGNDEKRVMVRLKKIRGIRKIVSNQPAKGAHLDKAHF